jgi:hypothetical protein
MRQEDHEPSCWNSSWVSYCSGCSASAATLRRQTLDPVKVVEINSRAVLDGHPQPQLNADEVAEIIARHIRYIPISEIDTDGLY